MSNFAARVKTYPVPLRLSANGNDISAYASTGDVDEYGERIPPPNWDVSRAEFAPIPMLWQHDVKMPIGAWPVVQVRPQGLYVEGRIATGFPLANMVRKLVQQRLLSQ